MKLSELERYSDIVIQCHDNPDPDTIGAGYALYQYFKLKGKPVRLVYSGKLKITKPNLLMLIDFFNIPIEYVSKTDIEELLITVDCQYGVGNVTKLDASHIAIIDHHPQEVENISHLEIRSFLASTCTLVWDLLNQENFDVNEHKDIATVLYYGLLIDSNGFLERTHPLDKDMQDSLQPDHSIIRKLKNSVLSLRELEIAGMALIRHSYNVANRFVVVKAQECDPNILGFISDLALQVDSVDVCVVYNQTNRGIKFSVRSCVREIMANELAAYLSEGLGSGGGHMDKAGGFISQKEFDKQNAHLNPDEYFLRRLTKYYKSFEVIDSLKDTVSIEDMNFYQRKSVEFGFVPLIHIMPEHTPITIRTLESDLDLLVDQHLYVVIGIKGEVYPITKEKFEQGYTVLGGRYDLELEYFPSIRNKKDGSMVDLKRYAKRCLANPTNYVYAKQLKKAVKIFTTWDDDKYMYGKIGDYLIIRQDDPTDIYVLKKEIFSRIYQKI